MAQKLQLQLKEVGSKLETPPSTKDSLVKLLKVLLPTFLFCLFFFETSFSFFQFFSLRSLFGSREKACGISQLE